jgi:hypothetical protein
MECKTASMSNSVPRLHFQLSWEEGYYESWMCTSQVTTSLYRIPESENKNPIRCQYTSAPGRMPLLQAFTFWLYYSTSSPLPAPPSAAGAAQRLKLQQRKGGCKCTPDWFQDDFKWDRTLMNCYMDTWTPPLSALLVLSSRCGMLLFTIVTLYSTTGSVYWGRHSGPLLKPNWSG